ncbi:hypothetical protein [Thermophagus xiamenensis]|uniref:Uncharacterized protein n=1 Tax=Thermophagus xiamenensis TaxID=385682 RepID=A0A1I2AJE5_9BACT|nr:hypothetical protein [Thermophagus xiamenensis]SFE44032.1 hypothetical protein SAMN05444380_11182 [Thermophagus xiamenensis]
MKGTYAKEKFNSAVRKLKGKRNIKQKIWEAFIILNPLNENDFPDDLKPKWNELFNRLNSEEPTLNSNNDVIKGRVENTLKKLSEKECDEIAKLIIELERDLMSYRW